MEQAVGEIEMAERGVYWARYLNEDGKPIAYAINSHGRVIRRYAVQHPTRAEMAVAHLWDLLDASDPLRERRQLRLVKMPLPSTEHCVLAEVYDPYAMPPLHGPRRVRSPGD